MEFNKEQIRHTLSIILHTQGEALSGEILDTARAEITLADHDFGQDIYSLDLRIPAVRFAQLEKTLDKIEEKIAAKLWKLGLNTEGAQISRVNIYPEPVVGSGAIAVPVPSQTDEKRIWKPNRIRLFFSHVSQIKVQTSALKTALEPFGIDGFVAHEDILPTFEWHREIEFALRSMDMLCALVTEDFTKSLWTDQEVGFALGRGVPVVAIRCGADPYGLLGKHQAMRADITKLSAAAPQIADIVAQQNGLRLRLTEGLVEAVCQSISFQQSKDGMKLMSSLSRHLTDSQIIRLLEAVRDNSQVSDAHGVPSQIRTIANTRKIALPERPGVDDGGFDDDIPF